MNVCNTCCSVISNKEDIILCEKCCYSACNDCYRNYTLNIKKCIMKCMDCSMYFDDDMIKKHIGENDYERYEQIVKDVLFKEDAIKRNEFIRNLRIHEGKCNVPNDNDKDTERFIKETSKSCPGCFITVYKVDGCNDMFCTVCDTHFHWDTLEINDKKAHNPDHIAKISNMAKTKALKDINDISMDAVVFINKNITDKVVKNKWFDEETTNSIVSMVKEMNKIFDLKYDVLTDVIKNFVLDDVYTRKKFISGSIGEEVYKSKLYENYSTNRRTYKTYKETVDFTNNIIRLVDYVYTGCANINEITDKKKQNRLLAEKVFDACVMMKKIEKK